MGSLRLHLIPYICIEEKKIRGRKRCIMTAIDGQWILLFQASVDRSCEKWCNWNNNRFSGVPQKHFDWCSWRWQLFGFALKRKFGCVCVSLEKWKEERLSFTLLQVSGTPVLVFVSMAWGCYDEKQYHSPKQWEVWLSSRITANICFDFS